MCARGSANRSGKSTPISRSVSSDIISVHVIPERFYYSGTMYRKSSGGIGFSFGRLMINAFPNFANDNPEQDAELSMDEKDILWMHQVQGSESAKRPPMTLDTESALKAGITSRLPPAHHFST